MSNALSYLKKLKPTVLVPLLLMTLLISQPAVAFAGNLCGDNAHGGEVKTTIDIGCVNHGNAIMDMTFAIVRFLTTGIGLVIIGSMIWAGIQYTGSRGDPNATKQAITRIRSNVTALLLFMFAYAIINFLVPGAVLK